MGRHHREGSPVKFGFSDFEGLCSGGMTAHRFTDHHWQLKGGRCLVNLWPTTGKIMLASGESTHVREIGDAALFIHQHDICQKPPDTTPNDDDYDPAAAEISAGLSYGRAILQIEYWTAMRDRRIDDAKKIRVALDALNF